jgi:hypothetical protein
MSRPKRIEPGPVGARVAQNVKELRGETTFEALSARLSELGRNLPPESLGKIEHPDGDKRRRVDVDDLVALAIALDTTPNRILLSAQADNSEIDLTPTRASSAAEAWDWATGKAPMPAGVNITRELAKHWPEVLKLGQIAQELAGKTGLSKGDVLQAAGFADLISVSMAKGSEETHSADSESSPNVRPTVPPAGTPRVARRSRTRS